MKRTKILRNFIKFSDIKLLERLAYIIACLTGNANFKAPNPTLAVLQTHHDDFSKKISAAKLGDKSRIAEKNDLKEIIIESLNLLATHVEDVAQGSRTVMISSGFDVSKEETGSVNLGEVSNHKVGGDAVGELISECDTVEGAKSYNHQITADPHTPESIWKSYPSTSSSYTIKGLKSGQKYWSRIEAIGSNDQLSYSDPVARIIQ